MPGIIENAPRAPARQKAAASTKPVTEIEIDKHFSSKAYTSGSYVSGRVIVTPQRDIHYDVFNIMFTGTVATRLDFVQSYTTNSVRTFLKLRMPIEEEHLPEDQIFRAGGTYTIPFHFVVPHQLTLGACNHGCENPHVKDQHLRLPPTLGYWEADDQAPDMTHIEYAIRAQAVARVGPGAENKTAPIDGKKVIKVLPASPEEPPLEVSASDERYCMSKTKGIKKNLLSAKSGDLKASAKQPNAAVLAADGLSASPTSARINLEFSTASASQAPPKIHSINGKIITTTYFGSTPQNDLPNFGSKDCYAKNHLLTYAGTHQLFNNRIDQVTWVPQRVPLDRRDSGYSTLESNDEDTSAEEGGNAKDKKPLTRHFAAVDVPINIPISNKKIFLPTFHNCLISRTYVLQLTLTVGPSNATMSLYLPLQIAVEQRFDPEDDELPSFETAMAQDADAYLTPRVMQIPAETARSNNILPGYHEITRHHVAVA